MERKYKTPREPDEDVCDEILERLDDCGRTKPRDLVDPIVDRYDKDEVRFALKSLLLDDRIRIDSEARCYIHKEKE